MYNKKKENKMIADPLAIKAIKQGKLIASANPSLDWRECAYEVFQRLKIVERIVKENIGENIEDYKKLTQEEKAELLSRAIRIIQNKQEVRKYMEKVH